MLKSHSLIGGMTGDGWNGGYWTIIDADGRTIAGGETDGLVTGSGGEAEFCAGDVCSDVSLAGETTITVEIRSGLYAFDISWNLDGETTFGLEPNQYADNDLHVETFTVPVGEHTIYCACHSYTTPGRSLPSFAMFCVISVQVSHLADLPGRSHARCHCRYRRVRRRLDGWVLDNLRLQPRGDRRRRGRGAGDRSRWRDDFHCRGVRVEKKRDRKTSGEF